LIFCGCLGSEWHPILEHFFIVVLYVPIRCFIALSHSGCLMRERGANSRAEVPKPMRKTKKAAAKVFTRTKVKVAAYGNCPAIDGFLNQGVRQVA
jgi:hypothetical protein